MKMRFWIATRVLTLILNNQVTEKSEHSHNSMESLSICAFSRAFNKVIYLSDSHLMWNMMCSREIIDKYNIGYEATLCNDHILYDYRELPSVFLIIYKHYTCIEIILMFTTLFDDEGKLNMINVNEYIDTGESELEQKHITNTDKLKHEYKAYINKQKKEMSAVNEKLNDNTQRLESLQDIELHSIHKDHTLCNTVSYRTMMCVF
eukprot:TRINITY_DN302_c0_g1_i6.p1 TRINITY_DN302_c0_g1~~TRINITY_DN302_c0_g1_i6.p1  ORF type:complete len:205 (-),score=46.72 TRINITY_DN302_c0_g1_i6:140-754(-)